jgi:Spy/CpxP family protein refolding chaperone
VKRAWLNLLVTAIVAATAGFAGARMGAQGIGGGAEQTPFLRESIATLTREGLDLTAEQRRELEAIEARHTHRRNALRVQISRANLELAGAMSEEMAFGPQAQTAIDHLQSSVGELQSATVLYLIEVRDLLTPEQRAIYDRKVVEALTNGVL